MSEPRTAEPDRPVGDGEPALLRDRPVSLAASTGLTFVGDAGLACGVEGCAPS